MNAALLRAVLTQVEDHPKQFDMSVWGEMERSCGTVACLAGWALILSGWKLVDDCTFESPDGKREIYRGQDIEREAQAALDLTDDKMWDGADVAPLFALGEFEAVTRLRELVEEAEATANA
jgi:hypothetical protein